MRRLAAVDTEIPRFAPRPRSGAPSKMVAVPVISSHVLQGLPTFIRDGIGEKALQRANRAAGFDVELLEARHCFIPQRSVIDFLEAAAKEAGEPDLGLIIAPAMNLGGYGSFGRYVFGADTLGQAVRRSIGALDYHSTGDRLSSANLGDEVRYTYAFALAGSKGYGAVAIAAAGVLLSLFKAYLPNTWRPLRVELDMAAPCQSARFEDVFQCPVLFNAPAVAIVVERHCMMAVSKRPARSIVTIEDVARDRVGGAPQSLLDVAIEQIRIQLFMGTVSIDDAARSLDTSVRTLQRELHHAGTDFRSLAGVVRVQRATELLQDMSVSITTISQDLGYSSPSGFARAFRKVTGLGPREFRTRRPTRPGS
ncbi:AraC family transcriptional regulator [Mesorhizobium yinganensis]|uniref:AraC family transcriptional regulator n=1 Tax=Mesorhizobium yinganensis TaxID=3157707 RepID=UPI0032B73A39